MNSEFQRIVLLFILVLIMLSFSAACSQAEPIPTATIAQTATQRPTSTPQPSPTPATVPEPTDVPVSPEKLLQTAFETMAQVESSHFEMLIEMAVSDAGVSNQIRTVYNGDYQAPDRQQGLISLHFGGFPIIPASTEMIAIADTSYIKNPDTEAWEASSGEGLFYPGAGGELLAPEFTFDLLKNVELLGEETFEDTLVYHFRATMPSDFFFGGFGQTEQNLEVEYWVGVEDMLFRKSLIKGGGDGAPLFVAGDTSFLELSAQSTYADYGKNVTIEAPEQSLSSPEAQEEPSITSVMKLIVDCSEIPGEYLAFTNDELGLAFCYPAEWTLEDRLNAGGFVALSPTGYEAFFEALDALVLIYPHETVAGLTEPDASTEEILSWAALFFSGIIEDAEAVGEVNVVDVGDQEMATLLARGTSEGESALGIMKGFKKDQAKAMAMSYLFDEESYRLAAETIMDSLAIDLPQLNVMDETETIALDEFVEARWYQDQPGRHSFQTEADSPILIVVQASAWESLDDRLEMIIYDPQGQRLGNFDAGWSGREWMSTKGESVHHYLSGFLPADAMLLIPEHDGEYIITVSGAYGFEEMGEYRLGLLDQQPDAAMVIDTVIGDLAKDDVYEYAIEGMADQPLMAYVRPIGPDAEKFTLSLELLSESGTLFEETYNHSTSGNPVFLYWVPREDKSFIVRVQEVEGQPAEYELTILAEKGAGRTTLLASTPFYAETLDVTIDVQENGDLLVDETITLALGDSDIDQMVLPLPTEPGLDISSIELWEGSEPYEESDSQASKTYTVVEEADRHILQWNFDNSPSANRTFRLRYVVNGGIQENSTQSMVDGVLRDSDTLVWQVIPPDRGFVVNDAQVKVTMPYEIELHNVFTRGAESEATAETGFSWWGITREVIFALTRDLVPEKEMEVVIAFSRN